MSAHVSKLSMSSGRNDRISTPAQLDELLVKSQFKTTGKTSKSNLLALFCGTPLFEVLTTVGRPNLPDRDVFFARIAQMYENRQFTNNGPMVREFESLVAKVSSSNHCVAICNATLGLELTVHALGLTGDIIVPSFTFVASVHALQRVGVRPVFCDVDPRTHCLDPARVEELITPETSAILGVALWGNYDGESALRSIADKHGLKFILDSAHAIGCARENGGTKRLCDAEVLSFHATKCIQALEGGAVLTDDGNLAEKLRFLVNFGFSGEDQVEDVGTNAKMNEAEAAMGLSSLDRMAEIFAHNAEILSRYCVGLTDVPGLCAHKRMSSAPHNHQYVVVEVEEQVFGLSRDELVAALRFENVLARRYFYPGVHRMRPYAERYPDVSKRLPVTEALAEKVMVLPSGTAMSPDDVERLCARIALIQICAADVRAALSISTDPRLPAFYKQRRQEIMS